MDVHTLMSGIERARSALIVVSAAIGIAGLLYSMGVFQRLTKENELEDQWTAACESRLAPDICDDVMSEHRWDCFKAARVTHGSGRSAKVDYDGPRFITCMDEHVNASAGGSATP